MFTGLVERTGKVISLTAPASDQEEGFEPSLTQLIIDPGRGFETAPGDSVSVNGCCLTVTSNKVQLLAFDVSGETLAKTALGELAEGRLVNLERALKVGDRLGGHMVSGHVDGTGRVHSIRKSPGGWDLEVALPRSLGRYVIQKGSICIDGVSLTVNEVDDDDEATYARMALIPTTVSLTAFKDLEEDSVVNLEVDIIGKYVERLLGPPD